MSLPWIYRSRGLNVTLIDTSMLTVNSAEINCLPPWTELDNATLPNLKKADLGTHEGFVDHRGSCINFPPTRLCWFTFDAFSPGVVQDMVLIPEAKSFLLIQLFLMARYQINCLPNRLLPIHLLPWQVHDIIYRHVAFGHPSAIGSPIVHPRILVCYKNFIESRRSWYSHYSLSTSTINCIYISGLAYWLPIIVN